MANKLLATLPAASALAGADTFYVEQSGNSRQGSVTQLMTAVLSLLGDTDGTLAANSDLKFATQQAVREYVATAVTGLLDLKGSTDCSANPNYPAASKGDAYIVTVAGNIGGGSGKAVEVADVYYALADNAGGTEASVGTSWGVLQGNLLSGVGGEIDVQEDGTPVASAISTLNFTGSVTVTDLGGGVVEVNVTAGGGGAWQLQWGPNVAELPNTNYAQLDVRNSHAVLDFDATTQEAVFFTGVLPPDYGGGGVTVSLFCALTSATSGTVGWLVSFERVDASSLDIDTDSFASAQTVTATVVPATNGQILKMSVNIANGAAMDSLAAGELFRLKIERDVTNDTAAGDAELLRVLMVEQ